MTMNYRTGFLCVWMVTLMANADAGRSPRKHAAGHKCRLRELIGLTKSHMEATLAGFDKANGRHLEEWSPGFPELEVHQDDPVHGSEVLCNLSFVAQGLKEVLEDQKNNLNPKADSLHQQLKDTISTVNMLAVCVKSVLGDDCSPKPAKPTPPTNSFEMKRWGHTLLKAARDYLGWLQRKFFDGITNDDVKKWVQHKGRKLDKYLEGSGYIL